MTREEAKTVFLNRGYVEVEGGTIYDADKWRESCRVISEWLEQEPCEDTISRQNDILPNIDKKVESYKKLLKHPVIKSIMGMDETQEQLDFVQPHKRIPVTLTVSDDLISRGEVLNLCDMRDKYKIPYEYDDGNKHIKGYDEGRIINVTKLKMLPSVKPQERTGHWIDIMVGDMPAQACDQCKTFYPLSYTGGGHNYCPSCGCRMVEPQERSEE